MGFWLLIRLFLPSVPDFIIAASMDFLISITAFCSVIKLAIVKKIFECYAQCHSNLLNIQNRNIPLPILNTCNITSIQIGSIRQILLRHFSCLTKFFNSLTDFLLYIHIAKVWIC